MVVVGEEHDRDLQSIKHSCLLHEAIKDSKQISFELPKIGLENVQDRSGTFLHPNIPLKNLPVILEDVQHGGIELAVLFCQLD